MGKSKRRVIKVIGAIDPESFKEFCENLDAIEDNSGRYIRIELCSDGGETYSGLAFYSRMVCCLNPLEVVVYGNVMSAATIILAAAQRRVMMKDSWYMIHDDSPKIRSENGIIAVSQAKHNEALEVHWAQILARNSIPTAAQWRAMSRKTTFLTAQECLALGVVDEVH